MNEAYQLTREQEATFATNKRLAQTATRIREQLEEQWDGLSVVDQFFITQFAKAQRTFISIQTLVEQSLIEDAFASSLRIRLIFTMELDLTRSKQYSAT